MKIRFSGVCERDMDLFLVEELVADPELLATLFARCGLGEPDYQQTAVTHSAVAGNGESDVEVRSVLRSGTTAVLLIENKVDAAFQPQQAQRYRERAENHLRSGGAQHAATLLFAPSLYIGEGLDHGFDHTLSYEELREHVRSRSGQDQRLRFKELLLQAAIEKCGRGYSMAVDGAVSAFWHFYWEMVREREPGLNMSEPKGKPSGATFVTFGPPGLPKGLSIWHKLDRGFVDLQFAGWGDRVYLLDTGTGALREEGMTVEKASKSAAIRLMVPRLNVARPPEEQIDAIREGLAIAGKMLKWVRRHESDLRELTGR